MNFWSRLIIRKRAIIAATLSLIVFTSAISVLMGIGALPESMLGQQDVFIITSKNSNNIINSRVDAQLADMLLSNGLVQNASAEIFGFAEIDGYAVTLRGVDFDQFMAVEGAKLLSGSMPDRLDEGLIGNRLGERLGVAIGDRIPLAGSFDLAVCEVKITGIIESDSGVADEMIVSLPLARVMTRTPLTQVSIIRVTGDLTYLNTVFAPGTARFSIYDLSIPFADIGVGTSVPVSLKVKNWGDINGTAHIVVKDEFDNETLIDPDVNLTPDQSITITQNCTFDTLGNHTIVASIGGLLPQEIEMIISVRLPYLIISAPAKVAQYNEFEVMVTNNLYNIVPNATVTFASNSYETNSSGICLINATLVPGDYELSASISGFDNDTATIEIVNSSSLPQDVSISVYDIKVNPSIVKVKQNALVTVYCQNYGNVTGTRAVQILLNGNLFSTRSVTLKPLETRTLFWNLTYSTAGERIFSADAQSETLTVEPLYQLNSDIVELLLRYGDAGDLDPSQGNLIYSTAKISEGNILIVLVSLAILSATLVTLGVSISFMKEINDNLRVIGILRSIGASSRQLLTMIFKEAFLLSLPAAAIGLVGGIAMAYLISTTDRLIAFGHVIEPVVDPSFLIAAAVGSMLICVGSSLIAGLSVSRKVAIKMIKGLKEQAPEQPTIKDLLGDEQ